MTALTAAQATKRRTLTVCKVYPRRLDSDRRNRAWTEADGADYERYSCPSAPAHRLFLVLA